MSLPISGYIAVVVLKKLEVAALEAKKTSFFAGYVDDTFAIMKSGIQADFKNHLISIFTDILFTMKEEKDGALPFPDAM